MSDDHQVTTTQPADQRPDDTDLDHQYHNIGISAVAAAAKYAGPLRNDDHAPAPERRDPTTDQILLLG